MKRRGLLLLLLLSACDPGEMDTIEAPDAGASVGSLGTVSAAAPSRLAPGAIANASPASVDGGAAEAGR